ACPPAFRTPLIQSTCCIRCEERAKLLRERRLRRGNTMRQAKCPTCGKKFEVTASTEKDFPFCSERCRNVDLGRWLSEEYKVPVETERVVRESLEDEEEAGRGYFTTE